MQRIIQESKHLFVFHPGNGTRYKICAVEIEPDEHGCDLILSWLRYGDMGGPSCLMTIGKYIDFFYFMGKMGVMGSENEADVVALLCFAREVFGVKGEIPHGFRKHEWINPEHNLRVGGCP